MLKVGLTGNIASGKSSVADVWKMRGAFVIDADRLARRAVEPETAALRAIVAEWGTGVLNEDGTLDRAALREIVFRDASAKRRLEEIVHPEVERLRSEELRSASARGEPLVVADIPLLFEVGLDHEFDVVVLVDAPEEVRRQRLERDRGMPPDVAKRMIDAQMPAEQKRGRADLLILNSGSRDDLASRAREVWDEITRRTRAAGHG
ncbi:MAG: dephospho-CoA kinase [Gemmatimonadetes bacterium]|nr:dephospho-CoA kinase [Gemmatimonadota bacterium]